MGNESLIASTTQFQTLLIALVLIVAVIYFFIELRRVDGRISYLEASIKNLMNDKEIQMDRNESQIDTSNEIQRTSKIDVVIDQHTPDKTLNSGQEINAEVVTYIEDELNNDVEVELNNDELNTEEELNNDELNTEVEDELNTDVEEILSNGKKEELESNTVSGLSILSYMPMVNNSSITEEVDNDIDLADNTIDLADNTIEEADNNIEEADTTIEEVDNTIDLADNTIDLADNTIEEVEKSNDFVQELDITEPVKEEDHTITKESITDMTIKELKGVLTNMDLPTSGNKTKLIQRIVSNQK